jgi:hypothetical protein
MIGGPKLSNFKIWRLKLQNSENMETKTAIKPFIYLFYFESIELDLYVSH